MRACVAKRSVLGWNKSKGKIPGRLVFGQDLTITTKHIAYWKLIYQWNQSYIIYCNSRENENRITHNYKEGDMVTVRNNQAYKCATPYMGPYNVIHFLTNGTITRKKVTSTYRFKICRIKPYHLEEFSWQINLYSE